jgi:multimeric flavodoxin WrbA
MKVLSINSSPKKEKGNTAFILNPFLDGMKEAGADVERYYTSDLNINPCHGDFNCWTRTGGKCGQDDDMTILDPKMRDADVLVLASPVYCDGVTGPMKVLMDRTVPHVQPFFEIKDNHTRHPLQENVKKKKIVLVSTCGLWEKDNFDPMLAHIKAYCRNANAEFAGALIRPHGGALGPMLEMGMPLKDILDASKEAGRQLVIDGKISNDTLNIISRELLPRDMYVQNVNQYFIDLIKVKGKT